MPTCLTVHYREVRDPGSFPDAYVREHVPLGERVLQAAGLESWSFGPVQAPEEASGATQYVATLHFSAEPDVVGEVLASEDGQRLLEDAIRIAGDGFDSYLTATTELLGSSGDDRGLST